MQEKLELRCIEHEQRGLTSPCPSPCRPTWSPWCSATATTATLRARGRWRGEPSSPGGGQYHRPGPDFTRRKTGGRLGFGQEGDLISETDATPGYNPCSLVPGRWQIIVGAYKVAPGGVNVTYEITFTFKRLRLLKGDLHTHTVGSDGVFTAAELGRRARLHGLDFLAITDHNQMVSRQSLPASRADLIPA